MNSKIIAVICVIASLGVIALAALQIFDVWEGAGKLYIPLVGVTLICNAYLLWNKDRKVAYFELVCAAVIFVISIVLLFIK